MSNSATLSRRGRISGARKKGNSYSKAKVENKASFAPVGMAFMRVMGLALAICLLAALSIGLLAGYRWITAHPYFSVKDVVISGNHRLTKGDVQIASGVRLGENSLNLNISDLEQRITAQPWIKAVSISRKLPGTISINVQEEEASFWVQHEDSLYYADATGRIIDKVLPSKFASLPVLMVERGAEDWLKTMPSFLAELQKKRWPFGLYAISWVKVGARGELEIQLENPGLVLLVNRADWQSELDRTSVVWGDLARRNELSKVSSIRADKGRVWVSMKQG